MGLRCYPSIGDLPGTVDYVIVCIGAKGIPQLIKECILKNVKICHIFSSGFSETNRFEGKRLENEIVEIARKGNIRILGPNCMGIYNPANGMSIANGLINKSGCLGVISQSGGNTTYISRIAPMRGVPISKAVSYGNASDIDESELLQYFTEDSDTKIICAYIEGIKDGKRFKKTLENAAKAKPTIVIKGGLSEAGVAAAVSHTGSLTSSVQAWTSLIHQVGAIGVDNFDEAIDLAILFQYMKPIKSRRACIIGTGGGASVLISDALHRTGLSIPRLPPEIKSKLENLMPSAGFIYTNPIDTQAYFHAENGLQKTVKILNEWDEIDILVFHIAYEVIGDSLKWSEYMKKTIEAAKSLDKPKAIVLHYVFSPDIYQDFFLTYKNPVKMPCQPFYLWRVLEKLLISLLCIMKKETKLFKLVM
jgi:acyl-CoA synthetase (NDP forming)